VIILRNRTGQSLLPLPPSPLPSPLISLLSPIAAGPPGVERVLLRPSLPVPIMLVSQTGLPPPLFRKPHFPLGEGVTTGVTLRDVKELGALDAPVKSPLFIALTSNESCLHTQATLLTSFNWRLCKCPCYHPDHLTPLFS
jgi:hypothetical protein